MDDDKRLEFLQSLEGEHWTDIRLGWKFDAKDFVERLAEMGQVLQGNLANHLSNALEEAMEEMARGIIRDFLQKRGVERESFLKLRKGDPAKVRLTVQLRVKTTMTMADRK